MDPLGAGNPVCVGVWVALNSEQPGALQAERGEAGEEQLDSTDQRGRSPKDLRQKRRDNATR